MTTISTATRPFPIIDPGLDREHSGPEDVASPVRIASGDVYVGPTSRMPEREPQAPIRETKSATFGWRYKLEQYGTDALVVGGATLAFTLLLMPEPIVTKVIGGIIALACILGGLAAKHHLFKQAYGARALERSVGRLGAQIDKLSGDIVGLESTRTSLQATNVSLEVSRVQFEGQVGQLKAQVERLDVDVNEAFEELNKDRSAFEQERRTKLAQLNDEISEADSRGNEAEKRLTVLDAREAKLETLSRELELRRQHLTKAEAKLQETQAKLLRGLRGPRA